jgi:RNA polymerase sigma-70 factor, ECF subfamily
MCVYIVKLARFEVAQIILVPHGDPMPFFSPFRRSSISKSSDFSRLYESARLPVFRYIYGLTGGPQAEVEDLLAETFMRAWKARHTFEGEPEAATGWLIRIAKRLVIDDYRRDIVRMTHPVREDPCTGSHPEQTAIEAEQRRTLLGLLAGLPDDSRELLTLRYMLDWKIGEIASYEGKTEDAVSVSLHRLLAKLRERWAEGQMDDEAFSDDLEKI